MRGCGTVEDSGYPILVREEPISMPVTKPAHDLTNAERRIAERKRSTDYPTGYDGQHWDQVGAREPHGRVLGSELRII